MYPMFPAEEAQVAPEKAFEDYIRLQTQLKEVEKSLEDLSKNPQVRQSNRTAHEYSSFRVDQPCLDFHARLYAV